MLRQPLTILLAVLLLITFVLFAVTYQVRFDQMAVITTFGKADDVAARITIDGTGSGAQARAVTVGGAIRAIEIVDGGSGYSAPPVVTIEAVKPGVTREAQAVAEVADGKVAAIRVTDAGAGYWPPSVINANPAESEAGLHWKWFQPVQQVRYYDARELTLVDTPEELLTADKKSVVLNAFLVWRINDPLAFFKSVKTIEEASRQLRDRLRGAKAELGKTYTLSDLTNVDPEKLRLDQLEAEVLGRLRTQLADQSQPYGIELINVGIRGLILPGPTTEAVFERMKSTRERLAQKARAEGESAAAAIKGEAEAKAKTILQFAETYAQNLRSQGDAAAGKLYAAFAQDEELAIYLRKIETFKKIFAHNTTFIIDAKDWFRELVDPPSFSPAPVEQTGDVAGSAEAPDAPEPASTDAN